MAVLLTESASFRARVVWFGEDPDRFLAGVVTFVPPTGPRFPARPGSRPPSRPATRQLKAETGLPPHQYVLARRIERTKQLLQAETDLSLAEAPAHAGFSDQSQFTQHFNRLVGVAPGRFPTPARTA
jgi:hypothetical protein